MDYEFDSEKQSQIGIIHVLKLGHCFYICIPDFGVLSAGSNCTVKLGTKEIHKDTPYTSPKKLFRVFQDRSYTKWPIIEIKKIFHNRKIDK